MTMARICAEVYHSIMRRIALALLVGALAACGAADQPLLAGVPHPNNAAVAGGAAAAAAAITLASPDTAGKKPEKDQNADKRAVDVKESVPGDVLDRLDHPANGSGASKPKPTPAADKKPGTTPKLPTPAQAVGNDPINGNPNAP